MWARDQIGTLDSGSYIRDARDFALQRGLVLRLAKDNNDNCVGHIPFTLFPTPFPNRLYQECLDIQPIISKLMLKIANDHEFIESSLRAVVQVDDFTKNLLNVNQTVLKEGKSQPIISCINRSDYMLDKYHDGGKDNLRIRQVEVNAIASSLSAHSYNTTCMHQYLMSKYRIEPSDSTVMPDNDSLELVAKGLIDAHGAYGKEDTFILLVSEDRSRNFSEFVQIELVVHSKRPDIRFIRRRFIDLSKVIKLGPNRELIADNDKEIALVYFRYGYDPSNYNFSSAWDIRLLLERSRAIKCPSINFHLSGAKKFQQILNSQQDLEKYVSSEEAKRLSQVFCKFWALDTVNRSGEDGFQIGLHSSENLVLKPQREGGGHNIFGSDIKPFLSSLTQAEDRSQYILMEYINSPKEKNWLLMYDDDSAQDSIKLDLCKMLVSELGIYGSILANENVISSNRAAGYLVRSKKSNCNEGGVLHSGHAGVSSLILIDDLKDSTDLTKFFSD